MSEANASDQPPPVNPDQPPVSPGPSSGLQSLQVLSLGGLAVAAVATFLPWIDASSVGAGITCSAWSDACASPGEPPFKIAMWLGTSAPVDAVLVAGLAALSAWLTIMRSRGANVSISQPSPLVAGILIAAIGALNYFEIDDAINLAGGFGIEGISVGIGVYLAIAGGVGAAVCDFLQSSSGASSTTQNPQG